MSTYLFRYLLVALTLTLSSVTQALPIQQADAFTAGDNKATLETSTGLIWLDFGLTNNQTFGTTKSLLDSTYAGWRLPTQSEVIHLWNSLFGHLPGWFSFGTFGYVNNPDLAADFDAISNIFGVNGLGEHTLIDNGVASTWPVLGSQGLFMLDSGELGGAMMYRPANDPTPGYTAMFYDTSGLSAPDWHHEFTSTFLVKIQPGASVPEPSSILLLICGILTLVSRNRFAARPTLA
jgi:hypothetical protein